MLATRDFVLDCLETAAGRKAEIIRTLETARRSTGTAGPGGRPAAPEAATIAVRSRVKAVGGPVTLLGYEEHRDAEGHRTRTETTKDYTVQLVNDFEPAESVERPFAYLVPPEFRDAVDNLQRHGLTVEELREDHRARPRGSTRSMRSRSRRGGSRDTRPSR